MLFHFNKFEAAVHSVLSAHCTALISVSKSCSVECADKKFLSLPVYVIISLQRYLFSKTKKKKKVTFQIDSWKMASATVKTAKFTFFYTAASPFSQFYFANFKVDGVDYTCAEQYMMHQKAGELFLKMVYFFMYIEICLPGHVCRAWAKFLCLASQTGQAAAALSAGFYLNKTHYPEDLRPRS